MKTNVYVDGFNLYYGCLKGTPYKWLDLHAFCRRQLPSYEINRIRYFTANVAARPSDPTQPDRQNAYFRALGTLPSLTIHKGQFKITNVRMALTSPAPGSPATVEVIKTEEKGSDVNLASYLLLDCFRKDCDACIVISNDSDLVEPIRMAVQEFGMHVVVLHPLRKPVRGKRPSMPSQELVDVATRSVVIKEKCLKACQFASPMTDANGEFHKPPTW